MQFKDWVWKDYIWNPSRCTCKNGKRSRGVMISDGLGPNNHTRKIGITHRDSKLY